MIHSISKLHEQFADPPKTNGDMKKTSWVCTIAIQLVLCCVLYAALNLGQPQKVFHQSKSARDLYFISVVSGSRSLPDQARLIRLVESAARAYKARFVVQVSELGVEDPFLHDAIEQAPSLNIPWYATRNLKNIGLGSFVKHVNLPLGRSLDIIFLGSSKIQDSKKLGSNGTRHVELNWLTSSLKASNGDWRVVVGLHPLPGCEPDREQNGLLLDILARYDVDVYLNKQGSTSIGRRHDIACYSIPRPTKDELPSSPSSEQLIRTKGVADGFYLHRVSDLEMVSYFVNTRGEVIDRNIVQKRGKDVM